MVDATALKRKIEEKYHALTRDELLFLRETLGLNNVPYTYLALQLDYPRNLRGEFRVDVKKFILAWGIPRSSFYKAIGTLDEVKVLRVTSVDVHLYWRDPQNSTAAELSQKRDSISDPRQESRKRDSESQIRDKKPLECALERGSETLQISTDLLKREKEKEQNTFLEELPACGKPLAADQEGNPTASGERQALNNGSLTASLTSTAHTLEDKLSGDGAHANFKTYVSFEAEACNWDEYACPGFGGSPPEYYVYHRGKVVLLAQERERQHSAGKRVKRIPEIDAYTRACIANGGASEFNQWVQDGRPLEPIAIVKARRSKAPASQSAGASAVAQSAAQTAPATPLLTPQQVLENRKRSLDILFESGKIAEMHELLERWAALKDGIVPQLLKQCPEWGFKLRRDRVVLRQEEA